MEKHIPIAYHEAGHAVAAVQAGVTFDYISIEPTSTSLGQVYLDKDSWGDVSMDETVGILLGGAVAQLLFLGPPYDIKQITGSLPDLNKAYDLVCSTTGWSKQRVEKEVGNIQSRMVIEFINPEIWEVIETLANKLLKNKTIISKKWMEELTISLKGKG